jgi:hypothetical protein
MKRPAAVLLVCLMAQSAWPQTIAHPPGVDTRPDVTNPLIWSPDPAGPQPLPNLPPIRLLDPLRAGPFHGVSGTERCLLVARRGSTIIAIELTALRMGPRIVGWTPKVIDGDTLTSKWKYQAPKWDERLPASNPVVAAIAASSSLSMASSSSAWSSRSTDEHGNDVTRGSTAETVTIDGKTYSRYTSFRYASREVRTPDSDDYFCEP